jgi:hypothetical protein
MRKLTPLLARALLAVPARAQDKVDTTKVVEQAEIVKKAVLGGDFAKVVDLTHPKVVEVLGGKEKMVEQTKAIMKQIKDMGYEITSYTIDKPGEPVVDGKTAYVILPTKLGMKAPMAKVTSESYLLGMTTDGGKTWTFVDGAGLAQGPVREALMPTLPKALKLPETKPPTVTKDKE